MATFNSIYSVGRGGRDSWTQLLAEPQGGPGGVGPCRDGGSNVQ